MSVVTSTQLPLVSYYKLLELRDERHEENSNVDKHQMF